MSRALVLAQPGGERSNTTTRKFHLYKYHRGEGKPLSGKGRFKGPVNRGTQSIGTRCEVTAELTRKMDFDAAGIMLDILGTNDRIAQADVCSCAHDCQISRSRKF